MNLITHFEIHGEDPGALAEFYRAVLSWRIEKIEGLAYYRISAERHDGAGVGGGITLAPGIEGSGWVPYVQVGSIDAVLAAAEAKGARLLRPKAAVARTAWIAILADPAGNRFAVWQADATAFPPLEPD